MRFFRSGAPRASATNTTVSASGSDAATLSPGHGRDADARPGNGPASPPGAPGPQGESASVHGAWADDVLARRFSRVDRAHPLLAELAAWARIRLLRDAEAAARQGESPPPGGMPGTTGAARVGASAVTPAVTRPSRPPAPLTETPSLAALLARRPALTTPPEVVQRLSAVVSSEDATPDDVAEIIQHDTYLTAAVLRIANSPLHAPLVPVESVRRAVMLLGMRQILSLVAAASLMRLMSPRDAAARRTFWRHAACSATAARALALACGGDPGRAFVAGMLHDIGHLLLMGNLPDIAAHISRRALEGGVPIQAAERELLGYDHCDIGRRLLDHWRLGDAVAEAAGLHHEPDSAGWSDITVHVHLGDFMAVALGHHMPGDELLRPPALGALDRLPLTPAAFSSLVGHVLADTEAMEQALFGDEAS
ncbi:HDOD domain-containing protein [Nitratidesulfovibrio sp. HK-II]|uniref:HDOD domain-containing protein n=1 Tax=Nitratidesulfovibrio sp. HK-II TaxID=2009266 RepID=UPI000E2FADAB|nr:HDOD domain-containing protein [Nitratidesulfovibrio sp. HK-II]